MNKNLSYKKYVAIILTVLLSIIFSILSIHILGRSYLKIKIILISMIVICLVDCISYAWCGTLIFNKENIVKKNDKIDNRKKISLVVILLIIYMPLLTDGFFFHDDYINFLGKNVDFFKFTFTQGRQIVGLMTDIMSFVTVENSNMLRIISITGLCIYSLIIYQIIYKLTHNNFKSFIIALVVSLITPVINVVSYGSMFIYVFAFIFSAISVVHLKKWFDDYRLKRKFVIDINLILSMLTIVTANFVYQATTTVAFFVLFLFLFYEKIKDKKQYIFYIVYIVFFVLSTGIYYITINMLSKIYKIEMMGRSQFVSNFSEVLNKSIWFIKVILENIKQVISSLFGSSIFIDDWMHYVINFKYKSLGIVLVGIVVLTIMYTLFKMYIIDKDLYRVGITFMLIPLSYYCFLILKENSYTSYYSVSLCSIILILFIEGSSQILNKMEFKNIEVKKIVILITCFLMIISSNYYLRNFWVKDNKFAYEYLKKQLKSSDIIKDRIHIYGCLFPGEADIYAKNATRMALRELGNNNYETLNITTSTNNHFVETLTKEVYDELIKKLSEEDIIFINDIYTEDANFGIFTLKVNELDSYKLNKLERIFNLFNIIPNTDKDITIVNLMGIY